MIEIKRESELEVQTWHFFYHDREHRLALAGWRLERRDTKRHKFRAAASWESYQDHRRGNVPRVPADVLDEARRQFTETLRVEA